MLKKLRRRFVAISMAIISAVLMTFYMVAVALFFVTMTFDLRAVLQQYSASAELQSVPFIGEKDENDSIFALYSGTICVVEVKEFGSIAVMEYSRANIDEAILKKAVTYVINQDYEFGHVGSVNLFYSRSRIDFGYRIAFADSTQYYTYMKTFFVDGSILIILTLLFFWGIMRFLATMCLRPVEKAWMQQKNFIADASHELKTPLTVILTNSGILKSHKADTVENQIKWIDSTYEEATHMKELVDKLLLLAKTDNLNEKNMFTDVDLSELAMQLALQYEPVAFEKGVLLLSDIDNNIHINGDSVALNQIIHILLDNAIKYSGIGGVVNLMLKQRYSYSLRGRTNYVYLSTRNTGTPIPQEDIPHIFERFYRSDKARTSGSGYGLGLSICKNLAQLHNADISVVSNEKNGTIFTVKFKV